jgi:hypothetical protein
MNVLGESNKLEIRTTLDALMVCAKNLGVPCWRRHHPQNPPLSLTPPCFDENPLQNNAVIIRLMASPYIIRMISTILFLVSLLLSSARVAAEQTGVELPSVFEQSEFTVCDGNHALLESWCNAKIHEELECVFIPKFDQYGCSCHGHASLCPTECADGSAPDQKTHYALQCNGIPNDEVNYVLKETHEKNHCENNAIVSGWCDDYIDKGLACSLHPETDEYKCTCEKNPASCPLECIGGVDPSSKTHHAITCKGIPSDDPNFIIKSEEK